MGAPNPELRDSVRAQRQQECIDGEPLNKSTRDAQQFNTSIYVNVTQYGVQTLGIDKGDEILVETYEDEIVLKLSDDGQ